MAEYIKEQPLVTSITNGDWLVFDTATATYRITRQNLLGQMDVNAADIADNASDIAANAAAIVSNDADIATNASNIAANAAAFAALGLAWATVEITSAEILDLFTTPIKLLDLAPSTSIDIMDASFYFRYNTAQYTNGGPLVITSNGTELASIDAAIYTGTANTYGKALGVAPATLVTWGDIMLGAKTSNPTTGGGSLIVNILYRRIS